MSLQPIVDEATAGTPDPAAPGRGRRPGGVRGAGRVGTRPADRTGGVLHAMRRVGAALAGGQLRC